MKKNDTKNLNVPTLRFREYSDCWQEKPFYQTFDILTNNTLSRAELNYEDGEYKNIHYGDILIKFPAHIDVEDQEIPFVNKDSSSLKFDNALLQNGDIVIADTAEDYTVGKATEIENVSICKVVSGLHTIPCRPKLKFAARYLGYYINSPAYHNQLIPYIQGIKVSSVSKTLIQKTHVSYPSIDEQSKIADFLSCLDEKIETQNKIISKYESLIKGIEDYIFAITENETISLISIATIVKGQQINSLQLKETGIYYYLNGGIVPSGYTNEYNTDENTISISEGGNSCGFVKFNTEKFWSGGHCYTLKVNERKCNIRFLYFYLKSKENDIMKLRVGSGLPNIQKNALAAFNVEIPNMGKQIHIAEMLDSITHKKEIEAAYLKQLQSQKTYLLTNLFI